MRQATPRRAVLRCGSNGSSACVLGAEPGLFSDWGAGVDLRMRLPSRVDYVQIRRAPIVGRGR